MLVDTGATYSMISESLARAIGIKLHSRPYTATLADGRRMRANAGMALFTSGEFATSPLGTGMAYWAKSCFD